ncbi:MAG TPA: sugar O-acetyltransferase, partial [Dehalococcoidia bacterium]|nr:sugar O-acetyltransferase [Dehalococcoidia bacterium]
MASPYDAADPHLVLARRRARELTRALNDSHDEEQARRAQIIADLFGSAGDRVWIEPPFYCDYGTNIYLGSSVFFNFNCVILDPACVDIGDNVLLGPNVQIYTATHPLDYATRRTWLGSVKPVRIGSDVWIGGGAIIGPGVSVGERCVVGAGSVVTRDVPEGVFA